VPVHAWHEQTRNTKYSWEYRIKFRDTLIMIVYEFRALVVMSELQITAILADRFR